MQFDMGNIDIIIYDLLSWVKNVDDSSITDIVKKKIHSHILGYFGNQKIFIMFLIFQNIIIVRKKS